MKSRKLGTASRIFSKNGSKYSYAMKERGMTLWTPCFISAGVRRASCRSCAASRRSGNFSAVAKEDFETAMRAMAKLRPHVDAFFDKVTVNVADGADKEKLRENRLKLLNEIRDATRAVADFSRIEG